MNSCIVLLKCITNMHVGNGDVNYNIIYNEVERDPVTNYPVINASGVKGALREYFNKNTDKKTINEYFGFSDEENNAQGQIKILGAEMVAIAARASQGGSPFYLASTKTVLERLNELSSLFLGKKLITIPESDNIGNEQIGIEGYKPQNKIKFGLNDQKINIYILDEQKFGMIPLPVLARNKLDNGISVNLWYEEVVPHHSIFAFPVISEDKILLDEFIDKIDKQVIQFGGNASIGYGLCEVTVIRGEN